MKLRNLGPSPCICLVSNEANIRQNTERQNDHTKNLKIFLTLEDNMGKARKKYCKNKLKIEGISYC